MQTLVVVTGPTGVGKTDTCIRLATHYGATILNADSRQIYRGMEIGTAAPTLAQRQSVPHHFVGMLSVDSYYSASRYEEDVLHLLSHELSATPFVLLTGGSMMYIDAVCDGIDDIPTIDDDTRALLKEKLAREGLDHLCDELRLLDPAYYQIVDRKNTRRVVHALEICYMTGRPYSQYRTRQPKARPFRVVKVGLTREREELYDRINRRVDAMIAAGLVEEARRLLPYRDCNALNTVGYKEMFMYLDGTYSLEEATERMKGNTRRYCRKQLTWLKRDARIRWFHPDDIDAIIHYIDTQTQNHETAEMDMA